MNLNAANFGRSVGALSPRVGQIGARLVFQAECPETTDVEDVG